MSNTFHEVPPKPITAPPHRAGPGVLAVPAVAWIYTQAVLSLFSLRLPTGSKRWFNFGGTFPDEKRNMLIRSFLATPDLGWLYFSDSDHVVPPDTLLHLLNTDCDVVSALYYGRLGRSVNPDGQQVMEHSPEAGPRKGSLFERGHEKKVMERIHKAISDRTVCEVDWVGAGALLVRRRVLEKVKAPWFFRPTEGGEDEDVHFCEKVRAAGFKIHLHAGVVVGHLQVVPVELTL